METYFDKPVMLDCALEPVIHDSRIAAIDMCRVANDGMHNAFPGICQWGEKTYIAFRMAQEHNPAFPRGKIKVLSSENSLNWTNPDMQIVCSGGDDRDPFFLPSPTALGLLFCSYTTLQTELNTHHHQIKPLALQSHASWLHKENGLWSHPLAIYRLGYWVWSGMFREATPPNRDHFLALAYHAGEPGDNCTLHMLYSGTGYKWFNNGTIRDEHNVSLSEPILFQNPDDYNVIHCLARREALDYEGSGYEGPMHPVLGTCHIKSGKWDWKYLSIGMHPGSVITTPMGIVVAGRTERKKDSIKSRVTSKRNGKKDVSLTRILGELNMYETTLHLLDLETYKIKLLATLPSGGDCAYPSMAWDSELESLLVVYYSQHGYPTEELYRAPVPADIHLAVVSLV